MDAHHERTLLMERALTPRGRALVAAAIVAVVATACSGSSSPSKAKTTVTTSAAGTVSVETTTAETATSSTTQPGAPAVSTTLVASTPRTTSATAPPAAPCLLLTTLQAFALVGSVRSSTASVSGVTSSCAYLGASGRATLSVTEFTNATEAHAGYSQAARAVGDVARGVFGVGDEAFTYPGGIKARVGHALVTLTGTASATALQTAARAAATAL
jgi:hypothetical protein